MDNIENNLSETLFKQMHQASRLLHNQQKQTSKDMELQRGQGRLLRQLYHEDGVSQKELADILRITPASLSELMVKLEDKGLITKKRNEADKRVFYVHLTDEGRGMATEIIARREKLSGALFSIYTAEEKADFSVLLEKFIMETGQPDHR